MSRLDVEHLVRTYPVKTGLWQQLKGNRPYVQAVSDVTFSVAPGEIVGLVGESGCGKTTTGKTLVRLDRPTSGAVRLDGADVTGLSGKALKNFRRDVQLVFQDPYDSLNPRLSILEIVEQPLRYLGLETSSEARRARAVAALEQVELGALGDFANRYPHQLSGGQRQRVAIARALVVEPKIIIADEPVSMLDVSVRASILRLLRKLNRERGIGMLLITHDLATAKFLCDRILVMYLGKVVEEMPTGAIPSGAQHPYSKLLLASVPDLRREPSSEGRHHIAGAPSAIAPPPGCRFHPRCPIAMPICAREEPVLRGGDAARHRTACHAVNQRENLT